MTPYEKFKVIFQKWFRFSSNAIGYNIFDKNFKITILTVGTILYVSSVTVFCIYTMIAFNAEIAWKGASVLSMGLQVICHPIIWVEKSPFC